MTTPVKYIFSGVLVVFAVFVLFDFLLPNHRGHTCDSPCTVTFPQGTQEDDFAIDYQSGGKLVVTLKPKGHR